MEDQTLYNQITVVNIDDEDFIFNVNREQYMIRAGETRVFPKFMVRPMLKHLIDKLLIKRDSEGRLLRNQMLRDELAGQIILGEEAYQKPILPTDKELVEKMNKQPELDRILERNRTRQKDDNTTLIEKPEVDTTPQQTPPANTPLVPPTPVKPKKESKKEEVVETTSTPLPTVEKFDQIEEENQPKAIPSRETMLNYAKNTLKLDVDEPKTKKAWDAMDDQKLFVELGLDKEEDLTELGIK